jgi:hypothetical protein
VSTATRASQFAPIDCAGPTDCTGSTDLAAGDGLGLGWWHTAVDTPLMHLRLTAVAESPEVSAHSGGVAELLNLLVFDAFGRAGQGLSDSVTCKRRLVGGHPGVSLTGPRRLAGPVLELLAGVASSAAAAEKVAERAVLAERSVLVDQARAARSTPRQRARELCRDEPTSHIEAGALSGLLADLRFETTVLCQVESFAGAGGHFVDLPVGSAPQDGLRGGSQHGGSADSRQSWLAFGWDVHTESLAVAAAVQLFLFAIAGSPASWLYRQLRDRLGLSYGSRTNVQHRGPNRLRCWLELNVPVGSETIARELVGEALRLEADLLTRAGAESSRALITAALGSLDTPTGQADAISLGRRLGSWRYSWELVDELAELTGAELPALVPAALRDPAAATIGCYRS